MFSFTIYINRKDEIEYKFSTGQIIDALDEKSYSQVLERSSYERTMIDMMKKGERIHTKKRQKVMYQFGGTIGPARYPLFLQKENSYQLSILPRPVIKSRPGGVGFNFMNDTIWLKDLIMDISELTLKHLLQTGNKDAETVLRYINLCLTLVPSCLRICNSFFTSMIVVGDLVSSNEIPLHTDNDDHISAILTLGDDNITGGSTIHANGVNSNDMGEIVHKVPFRHGRLQVGNFNEIYHGAETWTGRRVTINLSLHKSLLQHFITDGCTYYNQFKEAGYPRTMFVAK